jgi:mitochondrial fission protein ELM1
MKNNTVWILADDRAGNVNQCLGVAEALGGDYTRKNIIYTPTSWLPNWLRNETLIGVDLQKSDSLLPPYPDIVIAAGRKTAPIAAYIKKQHPQCFLVQLMWPNYPIRCFDLIAIPEHDGKPLRYKNCITTIATPHRITAKILAEAKPYWQSHFAAYPAPYLSLIVGGSTKYNRFTTKHAKELGKHASALAASLGASLLVTTSRRTGKKAEIALKEAITVPYFFHNWETGGENPYFGVLAHGEVIIVTGDSMSMCSEASATGKPVLIYAPPSITPRKYQRLHKALYLSHNAAPFPGKIPQTISPLANSAQEVAAAIRARFLNI